VDVEEIVAAAQAILEAHGMKTDFRRGHDIAFYRCETLPDRHLELVIRPRGGTISYLYLPSKASWRLRGDRRDELESSLAPLCEEKAFEPPRPVPDSGALIKQPSGP
jgi:hypothetical protein